MLTNPTPIETPAVAAKTYDKLHLYSLTAIQPTGDSWQHHRGAASRHR
jgi:hypothetical protein